MKLLLLRGMLRIALFAGSWGMGTAPAALADPPPPSTESIASVISFSPTAFDCSQDDPAPGISGTTASCTGIAYSNGMGTGSAQASSFFGELHASADIAADANGSGSASASASFHDLLGTNLAGTVHVDAEVDGTMTLSPPEAIQAGSGPTATFTLSLNSADNSQGDTCLPRFYDIGPAHQSCSVEFAINPGDTLNLYGTLSASSVAYNGPSSSTSVGADFSNTARITNVVLLDASHRPVPGALFQFGSGASYPIDVPEPAADAALEAGALALAILRLRRRARAHPRGRPSDARRPRGDHRYGHDDRARDLPAGDSRLRRVVDRTREGRRLEWLPARPESMDRLLAWAAIRRTKSRN